MVKGKYEFSKGQKKVNDECKQSEFKGVKMIKGKYICLGRSKYECKEGKTVKNRFFLIKDIN